MEPLTTTIAVQILINYIAALMRDLTAIPVIAAIKGLKAILCQRSKAIDIEAEFDNLNRELESMNAFLRDAESSLQTSASQAIWLEQVKNAARDIRDMVDQIVYYGLGQEWDKSCSSKAEEYLNAHLRKIKDEFKSGIPERRARYMKENQPAWKEQRSHGGHPMWHQPPAVDDVIGMEQDVDTVIEWLKSDDSKNTVISICGMVGLGKTTLAARACTDRRIQQHFESSAWVSAAQSNEPEQLLRSILKQVLEPKPEPEMLLRSILKQVLEVTKPEPEQLRGILKQVLEPGKETTDNLERSGRSVLLDLLHECLRQRRCLIVLDDVSSRNAHSDFSCILKNDTANSRFIVTTRDQRVASTLSPRGHILNLKSLPERDAWTLFCKKAFWNEPDASCPEDLVEWARSMVAKCEGLPLGIVALGNFMASKDRKATTWQRLHNSIRSELSSDETLLNMSSILMRSFDHLPYHLRKCYLYCCSLFPENLVFKKGWLFRLWSAEGFIEETHRTTMEEVAEGYLDELILLNMLQVAKKDESGRIVSCRVHGLMREVSLSAADGDEICAALDDEKSMAIDEKARRLSVQVSISEQLVSPLKRKRKQKYLKLKMKVKKEKTPVAINSLSRLRSLVFFAPSEASAAAFLSMSPDLMLLRVLELKDVPIDDVPDAVVDLFSLRYLSLRDTRVKHLPKHINRLQMLETLDVRGSKVSCVPRRLTEIRGFRHLLIYQGRVTATGHSRVSQLKGLRTLKSIEANEVRLISDLASLTQLRCLGLTNLQEFNGDKLCDSVRKLGQLLSLTVKAAPGEPLKLDSLASPPPYLRKLVLKGQMWGAPQWFNLLHSLTHLYLLDSQLEESCSPLPLLEKLRNLVHLTLQMAYNGEQLCFRANQFLRLRSLSIAEFKCLSKLCFKEGALPSLSVLHLYSCKDLQAGGLEGVGNLPALQHLYMQQMPANLRSILVGDHRLKKGSGWKSISRSLSWF